MATVYEYVKSLLAGCGRESEMMEAVSILYSTAEEYHSGRVTDGDLTMLCSKICEGLAEYARLCGKPLPIDRCTDDLVKAVKASVPRGTFRSMITALRARRRAGGTAPTGGVIP